MSRALRQPHRKSRSPRGVTQVDRDAADQALAKQLREERRQEALDEVRREQERLERRIEREKLEPAIGPAAGADYHPPTFEPEHGTDESELADIAAQTEPLRLSENMPRLALRFPDLPWEGEGNTPGAIGEARTMLGEGYNLRKVISTYDVGLKWFDDIPLDEMGFGLSHTR